MGLPAELKGKLRWASCAKARAEGIAAHEGYTHGVGDRLAWFLHAAALAKLQRRQLVTTWPVTGNVSQALLLRSLRFPPELRFVEAHELPPDAEWPGSASIAVASKRSSGGGGGSTSSRRPSYNNKPRTRPLPTRVNGADIVPEVAYQRRVQEGALDANVTSLDAYLAAFDAAARQLRFVGTPNGPALDHARAHGSVPTEAPRAYRALHVRQGGNKGKSPTERRNAWHRLHATLCAVEAASGGDEDGTGATPRTTPPWLVASDDAPFAARLRRWLPRALPATASEPPFCDGNTALSHTECVVRRFEFDVQELFGLARASLLVLSTPGASYNDGWSSFSFVASQLGRVPLIAAVHRHSRFELMARLAGRRLRDVHVFDPLFEPATGSSRPASTVHRGTAIQREFDQMLALPFNVSCAAFPAPRPATPLPLLPYV